MAEKRDYYEVLGVDKNADADAIKRAFRQQAKKNHPDLNPGDKAAEERFKEINEAYQVLSDPQKRAQYDQFGFSGPQQGFSGGEGGFSGFGGGFGGFGFDDIFSSFFGGGGASGGRRGPVPGDDIRLEMTLDFVEAAKGCEKEILEEIETFPYNICVHWYSGDAKTLKAYIDRGCYFTLGPDRGPDITDIPLDRLFLETDGLESLQWMYRHGKEIPGRDASAVKTPSSSSTTSTTPPPTLLYPTIADIPRCLAANMDYLSEKKAMYRKDLEEKLRDNLRNFLLNR